MGDEDTSLPSQVETEGLLRRYPAVPCNLRQDVDPVFKYRIIRV